MGDQHMTGIRGLDSCPDQLSFLFSHMEAVLAHQRYDLEIDCDVHGVQNLADLWFANLIITFIVEIDLVDRAAGGDDEQF